ncbi:hypothetical protein LCGC14_0176470 [marine sediment metagenome]|uniref:Uncharacterized protein n=1 Tax=marine sediment metagenome TaxID=412755 RepID=A0A0F9XU10_9ZZZZ
MFLDKSKLFSIHSVIGAFISSGIAVIIYKTENQISVLDSFIFLLFGFVPFYIFLVFLDMMNMLDTEKELENNE